MDFLSSSFKSVLGSQAQGQTLSGAETVERLVERVQSSTLLEDRRDACRALKALSRKYRLEVGAQGMDALRFLLETDRQDYEIVSYALEALCNVMSRIVFEEEECPETGHEALLHVGEQFTEMFLKRSENVTLILSFLEEYDFKVRWPALKLLSTLLSNKLRDIQEIILVSPMGVSKLMDMLSDSREVIRNETLLLLIQLTKSNANIQKIVAFENAFDRLFDVIAEEGGSDGGIVVEDCLLLMYNLLKNNTSNQNFFKEGSYIKRLLPLFEIPPDGAEDTAWPPQKVSNLLCVLQSHCRSQVRKVLRQEEWTVPQPITVQPGPQVQPSLVTAHPTPPVSIPFFLEYNLTPLFEIVRCLVSPSNPNQVTGACQRDLFSCGILEALAGGLLMASRVPSEALTETIVTLGEAIRGSHQNQDYFASVLAPSNPPKEAIVVLLMSMVNEKQPFGLRTAVLYCFQCYLFKNQVGQARLVQTLLPASVEVNKITLGQLLCSGLFSHDPLSNWLSSVSLSHALIENPQEKENLLRVLLAPNPSSPPVSLLQQLSTLLQQSSRVQSKVGFLILLCSWLVGCESGVRSFLEHPSNVPYLTAQAGSTERDEYEEVVQGLCALLMGICLVFNDNTVPTYTKDSLRRLIENRVGLETFLSKLGEISRHELYSKASKLPQPKSSSPHELLFDYEFCKLFKAYEGLVVKAVTPQSSEIESGSELSDSSLLGRYKELIREQDEKQRLLEATLRRLEGEKQQLTDSLQAALKENTLLRAISQSNSSGDNNGNMEILAELQRSKEECRLKDLKIQELENDLRNAQIKQITSQVQDVAISNGQTYEELLKEVTQLKSEQEDLLLYSSDLEEKVNYFKEKLRSFGEKVDSEEGEEVEEPTAAGGSPHQTI